MNGLLLSVLLDALLKAQERADKAYSEGRLDDGFRHAKDFHRFADQIKFHTGFDPRCMWE